MFGFDIFQKCHNECLWPCFLLDFCMIYISSCVFSSPIPGLSVRKVDVVEDVLFRGNWEGLLGLTSDQWPQGVFVQRKPLITE